MSWFETKEEKQQRVEKEYMALISRVRADLDDTFDQLNDTINKQQISISDLQNTNEHQEREIKHLKEQYAALKETVEDDLSIIETTKEQNELLKDNLHRATERERAKNSDEPYAEVVTWKLTDAGTLETSIDWNPAFIQHLLEHGYRGSSDSEIIERWLRGIYVQFSGNEA